CLRSSGRDVILGERTRPRFAALRGADSGEITPMRNIPVILAALAMTASARADTPATSLRGAIDKTLRRVEQGSANYIKNRQCFSCHHQAMSILTMTAAQKRGFTVAPAKLRRQVDFTLDTFRPKIEQIRKGQGIPGGNTMAAYALFTLEAAGHPPDETTAA